MYIRCGTFSKNITIHTVVYSADVRFWPTLRIVNGPNEPACAAAFLGEKVNRKQVYSSIQWARGEMGQNYFSTHQSTE